MGMGTRRRRQRQEQIWIAQQELAKGPAHPFYQRVNELLEEKKFDEFAEKECAKFYAETMGRPSVAPGIYFRLLLVGYFEGIDSERGIARQREPPLRTSGPGRRSETAEPSQTETPPAIAAQPTGSSDT